MTMYRQTDSQARQIAFRLETNAYITASAVAGAPLLAGITTPVVHYTSAGDIARRLAKSPFIQQVPEPHLHREM